MTTETETTTAEVTASDKLVHEITVATDASIGVIAIRCPETEVYRVVDDLYALAMSQDLPFKLHNSEQGWCDYVKVDPLDSRAEPFDPLKPQANDNGTADIGKAFAKLYGAPDNSFPEEGFFVMLDLYFSFDEMKTQTRIRKQVQAALDNGQRLFVIVPHSANLPEALSPLMHLVEFDYPSAAELSDSLDDVMAALDDEDTPELSQEERDAIISNGLGMTVNSFETAAAVAITEYTARHGELEGFSAEDIMKSIRSYKVQMLKKTEVLELQPSVPEDQIGGMTLFKEWMHERKRTYTDEAKEHGVTPSRGCLVVGPPGCKAAGTTIHYRRGKRNSSRSLPIEDFVRKFHGEALPNSRPWKEGIDTFVQSWDSETGHMFYNRVVNALYTGKKPCLSIVTDDDYVTLTANDGLLRSDGVFVRASDLKVGDTVIMRGSMKPQNQGGRNINRPRVVVEGLKYYNSGWDKHVYDDAGDYEYKRQHRARLVIEAHMNGIPYDDYLYALKSIPDHPYRSVLPPHQEVHHLDEDPLNDKLGNLQVVSKSEHLAMHKDTWIYNFNVQHTKTTVIRDIQRTGLLDTFDLQMEPIGANFYVNNGLIVHNTGKSLAAKAAGSILNLPVIRFDVGRVFGQYIGQSETAMRGVLQLIDAMAPCVLMLDEIDKGFSGASGGSESNGGTTQRVFGTFLTWMQEREQMERPVFLILTANRVEGLPPELLRRGRIDETWSINVPNGEEREAILGIHLAKRGQSLPAGDMKAGVRITKDLVGAEIEALVEDALVMSLANKKPGVTFETLETAKGHLKAMHSTRKAEFDAMAAWAKENARPASVIAEAKFTPSKAKGGTGTIKRTGRIKTKVKRNPS